MLHPIEPTDVASLQDALQQQRYICGRELATALFLALSLKRPLFLEGEAGVGKTQIAKSLAEALGRKLIRLQCYEGIDAASALYDWDYPAQMMAIRLAEASGQTDTIAGSIYSERFLLTRPLLEALRPQEGGRPVLLIDELDRADEAFEAFLLEILSEFQVTIPEIGPVRAAEPPIVIITSNRTREVHDALKRRCLYHWVEYPSREREIEILHAQAPHLPATLSEQAVAFSQRLREEDMFKKPGVAETLDWATALHALNVSILDPQSIRTTLGALLKYQDDIETMTPERIGALLSEQTHTQSAASGTA